MITEFLGRKTIEVGSDSVAHGDSVATPAVLVGEYSKLNLKQIADNSELLAKLKSYRDKLALIGVDAEGGVVRSENLDYETARRVFDQHSHDGATIPLSKLRLGPGANLQAIPYSGGPWFLARKNGTVCSLNEPIREWRIEATCDAIEVMPEIFDIYSDWVPLSVIDSNGALDVQDLHDALRARIAPNTSFNVKIGDLHAEVYFDEDAAANHFINAVDWWASDDSMHERVGTQAIVANAMADTPVGATLRGIVSIDVKTWGVLFPESKLETRVEDRASTLDIVKLANLTPGEAFVTARSELLEVVESAHNRVKAKLFGDGELRFFETPEELDVIRIELAKKVA